MTTVNEYDKGDSVRLRGTWSIGSVLTDPTGVTLKVKSPSGVVTTYTYPADITKESTGIFYKDIPVNDDGIWYYRFEGTGAVQAAGEHSFKVKPSEF